MYKWNDVQMKWLNKWNEWTIEKNGQMKWMNKWNECTNEIKRTNEMNEQMN
jgi:hypothetical protein